ncbi:MAG TPA: two-component sensor histidine kinase, partial [Spirochaetaceae bacterium]|nr:two-component sensor histidine kinase [Spirochaetaceae bacterium]
RRNHATSIRGTLQVTNIVFILATLVPLLISTLYYNITLNQYEGIIENVYGANSLSTRLRGDIYTTIWNVVAGKTEFKDGSQYELIGRIQSRLDELEKNATSADNGYLIQVARNALETIAGYVDKIGANIASNQPVFENERLLGEIGSVGELLYDVIQKFVASEMELAYEQNAIMQRSIDLMTLLQIAFFASILIFLFLNFQSLNRNVNLPIYRLKAMASRIAQGDLTIRAEKPEISELDDLTMSLNTMAGKLGELIQQNVQKQRNLQKAEMKVLQAQIAPHFLYNTLDTIVSLAEDGQNEGVATMTFALSNFFRLSLSKGRDWVTLQEEKSHVESYLAIQKMRYGAILEYDIDIAADILDTSMLKILLQPLVENAIYHGIKKTRRPGLVRLTGEAQGDRLVLTVEDDGLGMKEEELEQLRHDLSRSDAPNPGAGFGLYNVCKRIRLFYEIEDGLSIESEYNKGCRVILRLPLDRPSAPLPEPSTEGD